jgi:hypothetical protein
VAKVGLQLETGVLRGGGTGQKDQEQDDDGYNRQENVGFAVGRLAGREGGHVWRATFWLERRAFCAGIIVRSGLEND